MTNTFRKMLCVTMLAAPLAVAVPAHAQRYHHDRFYNGAYQGGRYGNYGYDRYHRYPDYDRHHGGIGPGKGALIGGAGGAALGALFGGGAKGALIGGAAGAGIGAIVGKSNADRRHRREGYYYGRPY